MYSVQNPSVWAPHFYIWLWGGNSQHNNRCRILDLISNSGQPFCMLSILSYCECLCWLLIYIRCIILLYAGLSKKIFILITKHLNHYIIGLWTVKFNRSHCIKTNLNSDNVWYFCSFNAKAIDKNIPLFKLCTDLYGL